MSEMKLCPFCGSKALTNTFLDYEDIENLPTNVIDDYEPEVTCENERCIYGWWLSPKDWNNRPIEDALNARIAELEAENDELKERVAIMLDVTSVYKSLGEMGYIGQVANLEAENAALQARIAELSQAVGLITTLKPTMVMDANHPLDMVREVAEHVTARIAELEAEKCVLIDQQREVKNILIDKNLHIDSLYEEGYKLQQRIAELERDFDMLFRSSANKQPRKNTQTETFVYGKDSKPIPCPFCGKLPYDDVPF